MTGAGGPPGGWLVAKGDMPPSCLGRYLQEGHPSVLCVLGSYSPEHPLLFEAVVIGAGGLAGISCALVLSSLVDAIIIMLISHRISKMAGRVTLLSLGAGGVGEGPLGGCARGLSPALSHR